MIRFLDGPAGGVLLTLRRAPQYLRVVRDAQGQWDALDQLDDQPAVGETIFAYRMASFDGSAHYCGRDAKGKRFGRTEAHAAYRYIDPQPEPLWLCNNTHWQAWAIAQGPALPQYAPAPEPAAEATP